MDFNLPVTGPNEGLNAQAPQTPNVYDILDPFEQHYLESTAKNVSRRTEVDGIRQMARMGKSLAEIQADMDSQALQSEIDKTATELASATAHLSDKEFQQVQQQITQEMGNAPQAPQMQTAAQPNVWQSIVAAATSLFDPQHAFDIGAAPYVAAQNQADQQNQLNMANYQIQDKAHTNKLNVLQRQADDIRMRDQADQASLDREQRAKMSYLEHLQKRLDKVEAGRNQRRTQAQASYEAANLPGEKRRVADMINRDFPDLAIPDELVNADIKALNMKNVPQAKALLDQEIKTRFADGIIDDADAQAYQKRAAEIAAQYDLPVGIFGELPTASTVAKQAFEFTKEKWKDQFKFLQQKQKDDLALRTANYTLAKRRLEAYEQSQAFNQSSVTYRNMLEGYKVSVKALNDSVDAIDPKELKRLDGKIAGAKGFIGSGKGTEEQIAKAEAELAALEAERDFITGVKQIPIPTGGSFPLPQVPVGEGGITLPPPGDLGRGDGHGGVIPSGPIGDQGHGTSIPKGPGTHDAHTKTTKKKERAIARAGGGVKTPAGWKLPE